MQGPDRGRRLEAYLRLERATLELCSRWTSRICATCAELMATRYPEHPEATFEVVEGSWPGCCQPGAADLTVFTIAAKQWRLPTWFMEELLRLREGDRPRRPQGGGSYAALDRSTGNRVEGVHCEHFGARGCTLVRGRGPLCLSFFCPPILEELVRRGAPAWVGRQEDGDILGVLPAVRAICELPLPDARGEVGRVEELVRDLRGRLG